MTIKAVSSLTEDQIECLRELWNAEYPASLFHEHRAGLKAYLTGLSNVEHWLMIDGTEAIQGWACSFERDGGRWFAMLLHHAVQGKGYGRKLLDHVRHNKIRLEGWVIDHSKALKQNGEPYASPLKFYLKCGFEVDGSTRLEQEQLSAVRIFWNRPARQTSHTGQHP